MITTDNMITISNIREGLLPVAQWKYVVTGPGKRLGSHEWDRAVEIATNLVRSGTVVGIEPVPVPEEDHVTTDASAPKARAIQWTGDNEDKVRNFLGDLEIETITEHPTRGAKTMFVRTRRGLQKYEEGEYLVFVGDDLHQFDAEDMELMSGVEVVDAG